MACHAARRLGEMNRNLAHIIAIELLISVQGVEFRAPTATSPRLQKVMACLRARVPRLEQDRYLADDLALARELVENHEVVHALDEYDLLPRLGR